jgi:hypothetical protein
LIGIVIRVASCARRLFFRFLSPLQCFPRTFIWQDPFPIFSFVISVFHTTTLVSILCSGDPSFLDCRRSSTSTECSFATASPGNNWKDTQGLMHTCNYVLMSVTSISNHHRGPQRLRSTYHNGRSRSEIEAWLKTPSDFDQHGGCLVRKYTKPRSCSLH